MNLSTTDALIFDHGKLYVNGRLFHVTFPRETIFDVEENRLVTLFRGHLYNYWSPCDVEGEYIAE